MRGGRLALLLALGGCTYGVQGITGNPPPPDLGVPVADLAMAPADAAMGGAPVDLATRDLASPPDMTRLLDDPALWHPRADAALRALLLGFWSQSHRYFEQRLPDDGKTTGYWTFAEAFDAVVDGATRTRGQHWRGTVETLYQAQDAAGWMRDYYDDENWMALALLRAWDLDHDSRYLATATTLYDDIMKQWDDSACCGSVKGGLWWDAAHTQKATAINAGAVITGARLAARANDPARLAFAKKVYAFWKMRMMQPSGHVLDHLQASDGAAIDWQFTYNEGLMVGAAVELYRATGETGYLADARLIADYMAAHETKNGVLSDGTDTSCSGDCAQFKGPAYRYLGQLYDLDPSAAPLAALLNGSATSLWDHARSTSNRFAVDWNGPSVATTLVEAQSAAAIALSARAALSGDDPETTPAGLYEAEDAVLHGVGLEASYAGYSGWGYVAGWGSDGQSVEFRVQAASAGAHTVTLRFSAGAGGANRQILVNGAELIGTLPFVPTTGWDVYGTVGLQMTLTPGANTITVAFSQARNSSNFLNLDNIQVSP